MKLSDFRDDEAIALVGDLMVPVVEILADAEVAESLRAGQPKITVASAMLKKHPAAVRRLFAILNRVEEYHCTPITLLKDLVDLLNDEELQELFSSAQTE